MKTNNMISFFNLLPTARFWMVALLLGVFTVGPSIDNASAQRQRGRRAERSAEQKKAPQKPEEKKEAKKEVVAESKVTAIVGGDIMPVTGPVIRQGTILVQDGKILDIGQELEIPEGAEVIDASGKVVTPGFVAISMQRVGLQSNPSQNEKLEDALNPFDQNIKYSLGVGITSGCVELSSSSRRGRRRNTDSGPEEIFPGFEKPLEEYVTESMLDYGDENTALCPCCGLPVLPTEPITASRPTPRQARNMAVVKLSYGDLDNMLLAKEAFYNPNPGSLNGALARHNWRKDLKQAQRAIEAEKKAAEAKKAATTSAKTTASKSTTSKSSASSQAKAPKANADLVKLLKKETKLRVRANSFDEINDLVDLALEFDYEMVIEGGIEAWLLADKIGKAGVGVIYTPRQRRNPQPGLEGKSGSFIESTRIFQESGIPFAVQPLSNSVSMGGLAGRDLTSLPLEAAFAVRGGADEQTCLEAITITPAKMLGLDNRIGSLEKGKDADILILNGGPLDYRTYVETAIVAGKVCYERDIDRVFPVYERK